MAEATIAGKICEHSACIVFVPDGDGDGIGTQCHSCEETYCLAHLDTAWDLSLIADEYDIDSGLFCAACLRAMIKENDKRKSEAAISKLEEDAADSARTRFKFSVAAEEKKKTTKKRKEGPELCKSCNEPMPLGTSRKASSQGQQYYSCRNQQCKKPTFKWARAH